MPGIRSFIAVDVDEEAVCERIHQAQLDLLATKAKLRIVAPHSLHFTLHFLGNVEETRISQLSEILQEIKEEPFSMELVGLGCFRPSRPRTIWVGVQTGAEPLIRIQKFLGIQLRANGFPIEKREYSPHLTVARVRSGLNRAQLMKLVQQHSNFQFGEIHIDSIRLKKSTLTPRGPIYEDLAVKQLDQPFTNC